MPDALVWPGLVLLGVLVGTYGTLIGAGGGFILAPFLLLLYPDFAPEIVTSISLGVVLVNASSGSVAYARQKRIDYLAGSLFAALTLPGAILGALTTGLIPRTAFETTFAVLLLLIALWLLLPAPARIVTTPPPRRYLRRRLTDAQENTFVYSFDPYVGGGLGLIIGFLSSLFGVGGGIVFVPVAVLLLRIPVYIATATSTFALVFTAGGGVVTHLVLGHYGSVIGEVLSLALGVLVGAQIGARVSLRVARRQAAVQRLLSPALAIVGARLLLGAWL